MFTSKTGLTCRASMSVTVKLRTEKYSKVFTPKLCLVQKIMSAQFPARLRLDPWIFDVLCISPVIWNNLSVCQVVTDLQASTLWYGRHWEANPRSVANKLPSAGFQPVPRWPTQISFMSWCKKIIQVSDMMILRYTQLHRCHHALFSVFSFSPLGFGTLDAGVAWPGPPRCKCLSSKDRRATCWKVTASVPPANTWPNRHAEGSFAACQSAQENRAKASDLTSGNTWFDGKSTTVDLSIKTSLYCGFPSGRPHAQTSPGDSNAWSSHPANQLEDCLLLPALASSRVAKKQTWNYRTVIDWSNPHFGWLNHYFSPCWMVSNPFFCCWPPPLVPFNQKARHCPCQTSIMQLIPSWTGHRKSNMGLPKYPHSKCLSHLEGYIPHVQTQPLWPNIWTAEWSAASAAVLMMAQGKPGFWLRICRRFNCFAPTMVAFCHLLSTSFNGYGQNAGILVKP